jgi:hypothetical protein
MQFHKIIVFSAILAAGGVTAFGRIGEKSQDLEARYGAPVSTSAIGPYQCSVYQKEGVNITVYYKSGASLMEVFAGRLDQPTARKLAVNVAGNVAFAAADADREAALRTASGINNPDEMFWTWTASGASMTAAYNPVECTLTFFSLPCTYAAVHRALANQPL